VNHSKSSADMIERLVAQGAHVDLRGLIEEVRITAMYT
jgi:hypothetical protein